MLGTAVRALTDPASLSKDASVSNEDLQEIALEAQVNSLFDGSSDSDSECVQRPVVLAPGNTKDQQNEQPKAGCSSGTSSLCPLDLIDEDSDHNQNDSEEEQIDEVGSPSPASSALKRFGSASNQQIRGNLEQAVTRMYAECELEKESGHAQQVWRYTTRRKGDISPAHKAARCAVLDAMCSRGCLLRCELSKIYQLSFKTYMADRLAENIELERCPQTCPDGSMSRVLPKLMTAFGFVRVDVFLPDGKQLRKHHLYFIDSPSLTDSLLLQMAEAQQRALTLASEMAKITGTAYMDIRCSISREARPILDRVIVATGSALGLSASGISDRFGLSVRQQYASTRMFASLLDNIEDARSVATKTVAAKVIKKTNAGVKHVGKAVAYQIAKMVRPLAVAIQMVLVLHKLLHKRRHRRRRQCQQAQWTSQQVQAGSSARVCTESPQGSGIYISHFLCSLRYWLWGFRASPSPPPHARSTIPRRPRRPRSRCSRWVLGLRLCPVFCVLFN